VVVAGDVLEVRNNQKYMVNFSDGKQYNVSTGFARRVDRIKVAQLPAAVPDTLDIRDSLPPSALVPVGQASTAVHWEDDDALWDPFQAAASSPLQPTQQQQQQQQQQNASSSQKCLKGGSQVYLLSTSADATNGAMQYLINMLSDIKQVLEIPVHMDQSVDSAKLQSLVAAFVQPYKEVVRLSIINKNGNEPAKIELVGPKEYIPIIHGSIVQMFDTFTDTGLQVPSHWRFSGPVNPRSCELVRLDRQGKEYQDVEKRLHETLPNARVEHIERVQNMLLWTKFCEQAKNVRLINNGVDNIQLHFHGTRTVTPDTIYNGSVGFDFRHANESGTARRLL